jgi:hypothetical protein
LGGRGSLFVWTDAAYSGAAVGASERHGDGEKVEQEVGNETSSDFPSWVPDFGPQAPGETCAEYAARILAEKYGAGDSRALRMGAGSEYNEIKEACERQGW